MRIPRMRTNSKPKVHGTRILVFQHSGHLSPVKKHAYQATYMILGNIHQVCVDILRGTFFVDGYPPSVLPESIIRNPLYMSFFRTSQFRVQRDSRTFKTTDKHRGHHFEFTETQNRLIIRQMVSTEGHWFELLPKGLLGDKVAHDFISNYTHWFDSQTKDVYFRRPSASDVQENIEEDTAYVLVQTESLSSSHLEDKWCLRKYIGRACESRSYLLSIHSTGFLAVSSNLNRLEPPIFVHIYLDKNDGHVSANLWRFNLSFALNHSDGLLYSEIYTDYYVPTSKTGGQNLGTLIGLQSGLVLEKHTVAEPTGIKKIFMIQHGIPQISNNGQQKHQSVVVMDAGHRNPPYFVYEVDQLLNRLRPGTSKSAFLYLAALHGSTSSPFPDPFTQLTGTEMAMWILKSGFVWSCAPYDSECSKTLSQISALSPKYTYYPQNLKVMQTIQWPTGLSKNSYAAYDGYALIVDQLLEDSARLNGLFAGQSSGSRNFISSTLCQRSYNRNINFYNKVAHLVDKCADDVHGAVVSISSHLRSDDNCELATLAEFRRKGITSSNSESVATLIMSYLPLSFKLVDTLTGDFLTTWLATNLRDNWLQLYAAALANEQEHELTLIFGAMLYSGLGSLPQLLNLHNIAITHKQRTLFPDPVKSSAGDFTPMDNEFVPTIIRSILNEAADNPPTKESCLTHQKYLEAVNQYNSSLNEQLNSATNRLENLWPTESIDISSLRGAIFGSHLLNANNTVLENINANLRKWSNNRKLALFITEVDQILASVNKYVTCQDLKKIRPIKWQINFSAVTDTVDKWVEIQTTIFKIFTTYHTYAKD